VHQLNTDQPSPGYSSDQMLVLLAECGLSVNDAAEPEARSRPGASQSRECGDGRTRQSGARRRTRRCIRGRYQASARLLGRERNGSAQRRDGTCLGGLVLSPHLGCKESPACRTSMARRGHAVASGRSCVAAGRRLAPTLVSPRRCGSPEQERAWVPSTSLRRASPAKRLRAQSTGGAN